MVKKRPVPPDDEFQEVESSDNEEGSDDDVSMPDADGDLRGEQAADGSVPFLDTFYGLASDSAVQRSQCAHALLSHCLLGPNANTKDATYAFRRILNGLCSGRAGARQGFASALASFLKIALKMGVLDEIQKELTSDQDVTLPAMDFVRDQLIKTTDPGQAEGGKFGKKKGSEERDYQFGRLFGILGIVRSGMLLPDENADVSKTACGLATDLVELHNKKKWMREPAAHGLINLLNFFYTSQDFGETIIVADNIVRMVIVPKLLRHKSTTLASFTAEKIAVALNIQNHAHLHASDLPAPLNQAILSSATISTLTAALCLTSSVVHPRSHVVWDVIWQYLAEPADKDSPEKSHAKRLTLKASCPVSNERGMNIVTSLMDFVIIQSLLGGEDSKSKESGHSTHERRALALSLVSVLAGGSSKSSNFGNFVLSVDLKLLEGAILKQIVVRKLFLDIIGAGAGAKPKSHMLKPMAAHVLEGLLNSELNSLDAEIDVDNKSDNAVANRRLVCAQCFLRCEPRFDGRTKTSTCSTLVALDVPIARNAAVLSLWNEYIVFLEQQILTVNETSSVFGYVDLLSNAAKRFVRIETTYETFKDKAILEISGFLMASAFFDCSGFAVDQNVKQKRKSKGKLEGSHAHPTVTSALRVKSLLGDRECLPRSVRVALSARFFSLLADYSSVPPKQAAVDAAKVKENKEMRAFHTLSDVCRGWELMLAHGAEQFAPLEQKDTDDPMIDNEGFEPSRFVFELQKKAAESITKTDVASTAIKKCLVSTSILSSTLYLHLLTCGAADNIEDDTELDEDNEVSDVKELLSDMNHVLSDLVKYHEDEGMVEEGSNPLAGMAEICTNVLSSEFCVGSQARGAAPKLLRDAVRHAWTGCLASCTASGTDRKETDNAVLFDDNLLQVLLRSIGVSVEDGAYEEEADGEMRSDEESENEVVFSSSMGEALNVGDDSNDDEMSTSSPQSPLSVSDDKEGDEDVEIDPGQLKSFLLEDSDADMSENEEGVLEHHAGADAALAQLIKLKQDARKVGRLARERVEILNHIRCITLFEVLLSKVGNILPAQFVLRMIIPILRLCKSLEKSLTSASSAGLGKKSAVENDKRALIDKLNVLLVTKICKARLPKHADRDVVVDIVEEVMDEARRTSSIEHSSCCSACMGAAIRSLSDPEGKMAAAEVYSSALVEWSSKRTTKLQASLFEDMIQQTPGLAQVKLAAPLADATKESRSPFLKSESFRLITSLFRRAKGEADGDALNKWGCDHLQEASPVLAAAIIDALQDDDMKKTKRVRDVLKAAEMLIFFTKECELIEPSLLTLLQQMKDCLVAQKEATESTGVSNVCGKIVRMLDDLQSKEALLSDKPDSSASSKKKKKKKRSKKK